MARSKVRAGWRSTLRIFGDRFEDRRPKPRCHMVGCICVLIAALAITGCAQRYYYNKPNASYAAFSADHAACLRDVGIPSATQTNVLVEPEPYRRCLGARGWTRAKQAEPAPTDWYRGVEDRKIMSIDAPPPPRPDDGVSYDTLREHCRALHLTSSNWRHNLPAYEACLRR